MKKKKENEQKICEITNRHFKCVCILIELNIKKIISVEQLEKASVASMVYATNMIIEIEKEK